ncbi:CAP domain-containing protein [Haloterrigena sp. H1]|uniref:CAP domain-containing protein n=1 Tax=Haloterrigena sp. H1 TaxID=2552943 RepID=UPI0014868A1C|nr:CAP domain-containing protein [Haloterrigena sp. H1]
MVAVLLVSMVGPGVAAAAPSATGTDMADTAVTNSNQITTTNSKTVTSQFQQEQANSCSPLETRLASIFSAYGYTVPDSLSDCTDHDSDTVDSDEPSETGPDSPGSGDSDTETTTDDDTDQTADESDSDEADEVEEPAEETSDTTDDSSDSDETKTEDSDESVDTDSSSDAEDANETNEQSTDDTTDSSWFDELETDEETDADTTTEDRDGDQTEPATEEETDGGFDRAAVERGIHEAVNDERTARGLNELAFDTELRDIARDHSRDMAERGYFSHTSPEGDNFADRYADAGYTCRVDGSGNTYYTGGENIAQTWYDTPVRTDGGTDTYTSETELANAIVTQWMNSPGHRENILAPQWENEGIGVYVTDDGKVYATQNFC